MAMVARKVIALLAGAAFLLFAGFMLFLWTGWYLDDSIAGHMSGADWARVAAIRWTLGLVISVSCGLVEYLLSRVALGWGERTRFPLFVGALSTLLLVLVASYQAIWFYLSRPFV